MKILIMHIKHFTEIERIVNHASKTVDILGVPFSTMTMDETIQYLKGQLEVERTHTFQVVTANPEIVMCAKR